LLQLVRRKKGQKAARSQAEKVSWEGVDQGLFEALRERRRRLAAELGKPPYVIFGDETLRDLARKRPATLEAMRGLYGIADHKLRHFGQTFLEVLQNYQAKGATTGGPGDRATTGSGRSGPRGLTTPATGEGRRSAFALFRAGTSVDEVARQTSQPRPAVLDQLCEYVRAERPGSLAPWVARDVYERVAAAVRQFGADQLRPLQVRLGPGVSPEAIRLVVTHMKEMEPED
jgi:ATP-dependent DNA helicase RecQ